MADIVVKTRADFPREEDYRHYVEEAYYRRGAHIESGPKGQWYPVDLPSFDWSRWDYRVKGVPDSIDWDAVAPEYKWLARDVCGRAFLYPCEPKWSEKFSVWVVRGQTVFAAGIFSSYRRGTLPADQSLVTRPED